MVKGVGPREVLAIAAARGAGQATRLLRRGGGTALPGLVAERLSPAILRRLTRQLRRGALIVTGTNGKTTTSRLLGGVLDAAGWRTVHNRSGSNLVRGLIATLVQQSTLTGDLRADAGLFEVDEATVPAVVAQVRPRLLLINNLFRDQLDRYGEIDHISRRWRETLATLDNRSTVVLNADDPGVAVLGRHTAAQVRYYGIADTRQALAALPHAADAIDCPLCGHRLAYGAVLLSHLGHYACPACSFTRPEPDIVAERVDLHGTEAVHLAVRAPSGTFLVDLGLPGFYNAYNGLAATAAALTLGLDPAIIRQGLGAVQAAFGRIERIAAGDSGKSLLLALVKNPVGFNEVLRMLFPPATADGPPAPPRHLLIIINDLTADGRDVSWLWDVDFEVLGEAGRVAQATCAGLRATDMANRLRYAGLDAARITVVEDLDAALTTTLAALPAGETLYV
ncbi:MAG TPA: MurT ligase domain-containing protein, partial [Chloroflexia bacterium]|nr:MurT ligase domain-containing protein [Chloroflexia bacterium]